MNHVFTMRGELDTEFRPSTYAAQLVSWFEGALGVFKSELREILEGPDIEPCRNPEKRHSVWAFGVTLGISLDAKQGARDFRETSKVISEKNLSWFYGELSEGPFSATAGISNLDLS